MSGTQSGRDETTHAVSPRLLVRNVFWLGAGEIFSRLIAFAVAIYLARQLGVERFGALGIALALVSYLVVLVDGGLDPIAVREVARNRDGLPALFRRIVGQRLLVAGVTYGLLIGLVVLLPDRAVGGRALALIFGGRLFTYALKCDWALRGREEMKAVAVGLVLQHVLYGLGIFALVHGSDASMLIIPIVHVGAEAVLVAFYVRRLQSSYDHLWGGEGAAAPDGIVRESLPLGLGKILRLAYYEGDLLLLGWLATQEQAGYFLASQKIVASLAALVVLYQQTAFPALSRLSLIDAPESFRYQDTVSRYALFWSVPVAAGGVYLSLPFMELVFGEAYRASAPILAIMLCSVPVILLQLGWHNQMLAHGRAHPYLYTVSAGAAVHMVLGILWVPSLGAVGAAWASLLGECVTCGMAACYVAFKHRTAPLGARSLTLFLGGGCMVAAMSYAQDLHLIAMGFVGAVAYLTVVLTLGGLRIQEVRNVLAHFRSA